MKKNTIKTNVPSDFLTHRLKRYIIKTVEAQKAMGLRNYNSITIEGGWPQLADKVKCFPTDEILEDVQAAVRDLDNFFVPVKGFGALRFLTVMSDIASAPGRKPFIQLQINEFITDREYSNFSS